MGGERTLVLSVWRFGEVRSPWWQLHSFPDLSGFPNIWLWVFIDKTIYDHVLPQLFLIRPRINSPKVSLSTMGLVFLHQPLINKISVIMKAFSPLKFFISDDSSLYQVDLKISCHSEFMGNKIQYFVTNIPKYYYHLFDTHCNSSMLLSG